MTIEQALSAEEIAAGEEWVAKMYEAVDGREPDMFEKWMSEDVAVHFANAPPTFGREPFKSMLMWQWGGSKSCIHEVEALYVLKDVTLAQCKVTYTFNDGAQKVVKAYTVMDKAPTDSVAASFKIYGDFSEVFVKFVELIGPPPAAA